MGKRKLTDGSEVEELENPCTLVVYTKCPNKWILIDKETGQLYLGNKNGKWDKINESK